MIPLSRKLNWMMIATMYYGGSIECVSHLQLTLLPNGLRLRNGSLARLDSGTGTAGNRTSIDIFAGNDEVGINHLIVNLVARISIN